MPSRLVQPDFISNIVHRCSLGVHQKPPKLKWLVVSYDPITSRLRGGKCLDEEMSDSPCNVEQNKDSIVQSEEQYDASTVDIDSCNKNAEQNVEIFILEDGLDASDNTSSCPEVGDLVSIQLELWADQQQILDQEGLVNFVRKYNAPAEQDGAPTGTHAAAASRLWQELDAELDGYVPPQMLYAYGGKIPGNASAWRAQGGALPGCITFRLGGGSPVVPPGLERALHGMRRGARARVRMPASGADGFGAVGFAAVSRALAIPPAAPYVDAVVRLVGWNAIDVCGDGGVRVDWGRAAADRRRALEADGEWRLLERRPSRRALMRARITQLSPAPDTAPAAGILRGVESWISLGEGNLPWGLELAITGEVGCVARPPRARERAGAGGLGRLGGAGHWGREREGDRAGELQVRDGGG